jgi:hypothetical protein
MYVCMCVCFCSGPHEPVDSNSPPFFEAYRAVVVGIHFFEELVELGTRDGEAGPSKGGL